MSAAPPAAPMSASPLPTSPMQETRLRPTVSLEGLGASDLECEHQSMDVDDVDVDDLTIASGVGDEKDVSEVPSLQVSSNLSRPMLLVLYWLNLWAVVFNIPNSALGVLLMILSTIVFSGGFISVHSKDSDVIVFAFCSKCHTPTQFSCSTAQRKNGT